MSDQRRQRQLAEQKRAIAQGMQFKFESTAHSGPLPAPQVLEAYEHAVPGLARIIVDEFPLQSGHRRKMEAITVWSDAVRSFAGLICGTAIGGYIVWTGGQLLLRGYSVQGFSAIGVAVAIAAGPFMLRSYFQSRERRDQLAALQGQQRR